jgi:membrane protein implicated in regulation of membrane protease activity
MAYVWLSVIVLAIIAEASTVSLVSIWFVPSACIAMILALCNVPIWIQLIVFFVTFVLLMIFIKPLIKKCFGVKLVATNADSVIGLEAVVLEPISNLDAKGQVKVRGQVWSARSAEDSVTYAAGEIVRVLSIEGVKLICEKKN